MLDEVKKSASDDEFAARVARDALIFFAENDICRCFFFERDHKRLRWRRTVIEILPHNRPVRGLNYLKKKIFRSTISHVLSRPAILSKNLRKLLSKWYHSVLPLFFFLLKRKKIVKMKWRKKKPPSETESFSGRVGEIFIIRSIAISHTPSTVKVIFLVWNSILHTSESPHFYVRRPTWICLCFSLFTLSVRWRLFAVHQGECM